MSNTTFWVTSIPFFILIFIFDLIQIIFLAFMRGKPERIYRICAFCIGNTLWTDIVGTLLIFIIFSIPFILYLIWGILLITKNELQPHIGVSILCLCVTFHCVILAVLWWWVRKWRITKMVVALTIVSVVFLFGYLLAVIFLPDHFTYTGTTMIFMCISFIFASLAHFEIDHLRN